MRKIKIFKTRAEALQAVEEGKARRVVIGDKRICLARKNDQFFAIQDECPHARVSLSTGHVNGRGEMVCPLHSYCYSLKNGREAAEKTQDAEIWRMIDDEDGVFIELD